MSRYDGLIIPRSYSEYINKTDAATLLQALQLSGVMDNAPTANSNHPTKSSGVYTALAGKQATLTFDNAPTANSNNPVKSGGILTALNNKVSTYGVLAADKNTYTLENYCKKLITDHHAKIVDGGRLDLIAQYSYANAPTLSIDNGAYQLVGATIGMQAIYKSIGQYTFSFDLPVTQKVRIIALTNNTNLVSYKIFN